MFLIFWVIRRTWFRNKKLYLLTVNGLSHGSQNASMGHNMVTIVFVALLIYTAHLYNKNASMVPGGFFLCVIWWTISHCLCINIKNKVSPSKHMTILRMELQASVMGFQLAKTFESEIRLPTEKQNIFQLALKLCWTGSQLLSC